MSHINVLDVVYGFFILLFNNFMVFYLKGITFSVLFSDKAVPANLECGLYDIPK